MLLILAVLLLALILFGLGFAIHVLWWIAVIVLVLLADTNALFTLFTASTIMPALLYAGTVLLYIATRRGHGRYGRWEWPVIAGAVIWLTYELIVLIGPGVFRDAQYYVAGALGLGLVFYVVQLVTEPAAMRAAPEAE